MNIPSYIKDTTDFFNKLSRLNNLPDNTILVTLDVTALYSNIPHNDGIGACNKHLDRRALSTTSSEDICQLIKFILENNVLSLNDEYLLQVCGTAMGTRMAPCNANIFMAELEENFLSVYPYKPLAYYRYIDDIFIIWSHGLDLCTISSTALKSNTVTSFSLLISPPRLSTFLMLLLTSMEATFPPRLRLNQQTHTHFFHTTVSTLDILNNLLSTVNFYATSAFVLMTKFFSTMPPNVLETF